MKKKINYALTQSWYRYRSLENLAMSTTQKKIIVIDGMIGILISPDIYTYLIFNTQFIVIVF